MEMNKERTIMGAYMDERMELRRIIRKIGILFSVHLDIIIDFSVKQSII